MEEYSIKLILTVACVVAIALFLLLRKYFFKLLTSILATVMIVILGTGIYIYRMIPKGDSEIGKHVYLKKSGEYLGKIEGSALDTQLGEIWQVRTLKGELARYRKANVVVK
jgi:hypothetical protein